MDKTNLLKSIMEQCKIINLSQVSENALNNILLCHQTDFYSVYRFLMAMIEMSMYHRIDFFGKPHLLIVFELGILLSSLIM